MRKRAFWGVIAVVICVRLVSAQQVSPAEVGGQAKAPDLNTIVQSLETAEQQNPAMAQGYTVTRSYKLFRGDETQPVSETTAEVTFIPPATKKYVIKQASGIARGKQMVRDILDLESVPTESSSEFSRRNYTFVFLQQEKLGDVSTYLLRIIPKRKAKNLLNGLIWVDTTTFRIQRIEGTPTKKPSWWITNLDVMMQFTVLDGLWLPTYVTATADVRLDGSYLLTGKDVALQLSKSVAGQD